MIKTWGKGVSAVLGAVLASLIGLSQMSCLSPADQAVVSGLNQNLQQATSTIARDKATFLELQGELAKYKDEFLKVVEDIKAKRVPTESGIALLGKVMANINTTQARIVEVQKLIDENQLAAKNLMASVQEMKKRDIPWYYWALPVGTAVAGIASMFVPGVSPLAQMLATANQQLSATQEAAGSLSRTLDVVTEAADAHRAAVGSAAPVTLDTTDGQRRFLSVSDLKQDLMTKEQSGDLLAIKDTYDEIRAKAKANLI